MSLLRTSTPLCREVHCNKVNKNIPSQFSLLKCVLQKSHVSTDGHPPSKQTLFPLL
jgi:hypothetical protein